MDEQAGKFTQLRVEAPAGVNFALEQAQLNPQVWDDAKNVSFSHGITRKCSGYEQGFGAAKACPEVLIPLRDDDQSFYWWAYAGTKKVESTPGSGVFDKDEQRIYRITAKDVHQDVTPDGGIVEAGKFFTEVRWTGDSVNSVPYLSKEVPYLWDASYDASGGRFRTHYGFPPHLSFRVIRTYKNFMIGLNFATKDFMGNMTDENADWYGFGPWSNGVHQNAVWWSHEVIGSQLDADPPTEEGRSYSGKSMWCDADPTRNSGWNFLGGSGGPIVDGRAMRDSFIIYRERSVWQMTYVEGINVFSFKELFNDAGALSEQCIIDVEGQHFVVGQSDIYLHNGVQKVSVADGVVRRELFNSIDPDYINRVFATVSYKDKQLWVCIPEAGTNINGACNVAYIYNWEEKHWSRRSIPDLTSAAYTILSIPTEDFSWVAPGEEASWAELPQEVTWVSSYSKYSAANWGLIFGTSQESTSTGDSNYKLFTSTTFDPKFDGENFEAYVEKRWLDMGDRADTSFVNKIYPLVRGGIVDVYMGGTENTQTPPTWKYVGKFDSSTMTKLSTRISGNFVHIKFVIPETSQAEIRGYWLEYTKIGRRG